MSIHTINLRSLLLTMIAFATPTAVIGQTCPVYDPGKFPSQPVLVPATATFGGIAGDLAVTDDGAATYRIPLELPAGRNGMQPQLTIEYNSESKDGPLGIGFGLSGLSSINSCNRDQFDKFDPRNFWSGSKCLDGQRLVMTKADYASNTFEYVTMPNSHVRVRSKPQGSTWFYQVWTPDGTMREYGKGMQDTVMIGSASHPITWPITSATDAHGNSITYQYSSNHGSRVVDSIEYGGAEGVVIGFGYENRLRPITGFLAGGNLQTLTNRLSRIEVLRRKPDGFVKQIRSYSLNYEGGGVDRLASITKCSGPSLNSCLRPTTFGWTPSTTFQPAVDQDLPVDLLFNQLTSLMVYDSTGDGRADLVFPTADSWYVAAAAAGQPNPKQRYTKIDWLAPNITGSYSATATPIDYNFDGAVDLIPRDGGYHWTPVLSNPGGGTGTQVSTSYNGAINQNHKFVLGDFNGDGLLDILEHHPTWRIRYRWTAGGVNTFSEPVAVPEILGSPNQVIAMDTDGDGDDEILYWSAWGFHAYDPRNQSGDRVAVLKVGADTFPGSNPSYPNPNVYYTKAIRKGDFNGDGLTDLIIDGTLYPPQSGGPPPPLPNNLRKLYIQFGVGLKPDNDSRHAPGFTSPRPIDYAPTSDNALSHALVADLNNDGRDDLIIPASSVTREDRNLVDQLDIVTFESVASVSPSLIGRRSGSVGTFSLRSLADNYDAQGPQIGDVDGDLKPDIVVVDRTSGSPRIRVFQQTSPGIMPDMLAWVREGRNAPLNDTNPGTPATYTVKYAPMTDSTVYENGACIPGTVTGCVAKARYLVRSVLRDTASKNGRRSVEDHKYSNGKFDRNSGASLGFASHNVTVHEEVINGVTPAYPGFTINRFFSNTKLGLDPRLTGEETSGISNGKLWMVKKSNEWATKDIYPPVNGVSLSYPYLKTVTQQWQEGTSLPLAVYRATTSKVDEIDNYGNVTKRIDTDSSGFTTVKRMTPDINLDDWLLRRSSRKVVADESQQMGWWTQRTTDYTYTALPNGHASPTPKTIKRYESPGVEGTTASTTTFSYDTYGNVTRSEVRDMSTGESRAQCTVYTPDGVHPYALVNAKGHATFLQYNWLGLPAATIDPSGLMAKASYDFLGRPVHISVDGEAATTYSYTQQIQPGAAEYLTAIETLRTSGEQEGSILDRMGRPVAEHFKGFDGVLRKKSRNFDTRGYVTVERLYGRGLPSGQQQEFEYDGRGRIVEERGPGYSRSFSYDGLKRTYTDGLGHKTVSQSDARGQIIHITQGAGTQEQVDKSFVYGPFGLLTKVSFDSVANSAQIYQWNDLGLPYLSKDAETGVTTHKYNAFGEIISSIDANGNKIAMTYDGLGRITARTQKDKDDNLRAETTWEYEDGPILPADKALGMLSRTTRVDYATHKAGVTTALEYLYDNMGHVKSTVQSMSSTGIIAETISLGYDYDPNGRLARLTFPRLPGQTASSVVNYHYAANGQLQRIDDANGTALWTLDSTDEQNRPSIIVSGDGTQTERFRDWRGAILNVNVETGGNDQMPAQYMSALDYDYDSEGNLLSRSDILRGQSEVFTYDALDRLRTEQVVLSPNGLGPVVTNDYDKLGNFVGGQAQYDPLRPTQLLTDWFGNRNEYDAAGNQIRRGARQMNETAQVIRYNDFNLPATISDINGKQLASFVYSPAGDRIRKVSDAKFTKGTTTEALGLYERYQEAGFNKPVQHRLKVPAPDGVAAILNFTEQNGVLSQQRTLYPHTDSLGSIDTVTHNVADSGFKAQVKTQRSYRAFGLLRSAVNWGSGSLIAINSPSLSDGFAGHQDDTDFGLVNMGGRVYDAINGRFLTPDPFAQPGSNGYAYVSNNPLRFIDPSGFEEECPYCGGGTGGGYSGGDTGGPPVVVIPSNPNVGSGCGNFPCGSPHHRGNPSGRSTATIERNVAPPQPAAPQSIAGASATSNAPGASPSTQGQLAGAGTKPSYCLRNSDICYSEMPEGYGVDHVGTELNRAESNPLLYSLQSFAGSSMGVINGIGGAIKGVRAAVQAWRVARATANAARAQRAAALARVIGRIDVIDGGIVVGDALYDLRYAPQALTPALTAEARLSGRTVQGVLDHLENIEAHRATAGQILETARQMGPGTRGLIHANGGRFFNVVNEGGHPYIIDGAKLIEASANELKGLTVQWLTK